MKKVINRDELNNKMKEAINLLCSTVKLTLGPKGGNVIVDNSVVSPFITNDGVTIAENIFSDDVVVNTILELAKEATIKTNVDVGDGTTTTLVLLEAIFNAGMSFVFNGYNPMIIKREIEKAEGNILREIYLKSKVPSKKELLDIACVAANDKEIGGTVYDAFSKVKDKNSISIREGNEKTYINEIKGYTIDTIAASDYFLNNSLIYEDAYLLLSDDVIYNTESIVDILNYVNLNNKKLVIISKEYENGFINEILSLVINEKYDIVLLKNPLYGQKAYNLLKDLSSISKAKINHNEYSLDGLGFLNRIKIEREKTTFNFSYDSDVKKRIKELQDILIKEVDEYEKDYYKNSISMLKNKNVEIIVGGRTKTERREKLMRYEDALSSISTSYDGICPGSGVVFYEISEKLNNDSIGNQILNEALKMVLKQIIVNSGLDEDVLKRIVDSKYNLIYNVLTNQYEQVNTTSILDSTQVLVNSFLNASSVAKMLITTTSVVINEYEDKKLDNYTNL